MQNPFQRAQASLKLSIVPLVLAYVPISSLADDFLPSVNAERLSDVQFLSGGKLQDRSFYQAGIEINLAPGALTYWRMPGDAGVPPIFSFEGSQNLETAEVFFPAPERLNEAGETAFGYKNRVTFPLHVTPAEPGNPVELNVKLDYAVCRKICLPETAHLSVEIGPGQSVSHSVETELDQAEKSVPKPLSAAQAASFARFDWAEEERLKTGLPAWKLNWRGAPPGDLFVEAPEGWYFETQKTSDPRVFLLTAIDHPAEGAQSSRPEINVTVLEKEQSFEFKTKLKTPSDPD